MKNQKIKACFELVHRISESHPKSKVVETLLIGIERATVEDLKSIETVILSATENKAMDPKARASAVLAARRMGRFDDNEFVDHILSERSEVAQEILLEESLQSLSEPKLHQLRRDLGTDSFKELVQEILIERTANKEQPFSHD